MVLFSSNIRIHPTIPSAFTQIEQTTAIVYLEKVDQNEINIYNGFKEEEADYLRSIIKSVVASLTNMSLKFQVIITASDYSLPATLSSVIQALIDFNIPLNKNLVVGGNKESLYIYESNRCIMKYVVNEEEDILKDSFNNDYNRNINKVYFN